MPHVRGHRNWWEVPIREIDFGRLGPAFGRLGQQFGQAFRQIGAFGTQPISFRPSPQPSPQQIQWPWQPAPQLGPMVGFPVQRDVFGNPLGRTGRDVSLQQLDALMFTPQGEKTQVGEALGLLDLNRLSADDLQNLVNQFGGQLERGLDFPAQRPPFQQVRAEPPGRGEILGGMGRLTGLEGLGEARRLEARGDLATRVPLPFPAGQQDLTPEQVAANRAAQVAGGGGVSPAGGGALTAASMARSLQRGTFLQREQTDYLAELKDLDPTLFQTMSETLKSMRAEAGRGPPGGPFDANMQAALGMERSQAWQTAKRKIDEERFFQFPDIYPAYLDYKAGTLDSPIMGFKDWREKTPYVQSLLRRRGTEEQRTAREAEQERRPARFAPIQQRA